MLLLEMGTLAGLSQEDRALRLTGLGIEDPSIFAADFDLATFTTGANAYYEACISIASDPHAPGADKALAKLDADVAAGKYGELTGLFGAAMEKLIQRANDYDAKWLSLAAVMQALADGSKKPEDFLPAAKFYIAASNACVVLREEEQAEIETLRLAKAWAQNASFMQRLERLVDEGAFEEGARRDTAPLAALEATEPLNLSRHLAGQLLVLARLQSIPTEAR
ncbi:MAG: hypothetical protein EXS10_07850 [Phycisphaerales bacterium]|nr:hypothetical protein [Phycisphaerales bacterium]